LFDGKFVTFDSFASGERPQMMTLQLPCCVSFKNETQVTISQKPPAEPEAFEQYAQAVQATKN